MLIRADSVRYLQYYSNDSVLKPHNPYVPKSESAGFGTRLENSSLDRGMGSLSMTDPARLASVSRTHSTRYARRRHASLARGQVARILAAFPCL